MSKEDLFDFLEFCGDSVLLKVRHSEKLDAVKAARQIKGFCFRYRLLVTMVTKLEVRDWLEFTQSVCLRKIKNSHAKFSTTLEISANLENGFPIFLTGKTQGIRTLIC